MKMRTLLTVMGAMLLLAFGAGQAQPRVDLGKYEYESNCASCHGFSGKGNGPFAQWLELRMPDLTQISQRNGGVFPVQRLYAVIDGRATVKAHGDREMPIWGLDYTMRARPAHDDYRHDPEHFVHSRIEALINHLYTLQAK
jgi:mono/diheme cytochrome c family protein